MGKNEVTSPKVASMASKLLKDIDNIIKSRNKEVLTLEKKINHSIETVMSQLFELDDLGAMLVTTTSNVSDELHELKSQIKSVAASALSQAKDKQPTRTKKAARTKAK